MEQKIIVVLMKNAANDLYEFVEEGRGKVGWLRVTNSLKLHLQTPVDLKRGDHLELIGSWEMDNTTRREIPIFFAESLRKLPLVKLAP